MPAHLGLIVTVVGFVAAGSTLLLVYLAGPTIGLGRPAPFVAIAGVFSVGVGAALFVGSRILPASFAPTIPTGSERQALIDEMVATYQRCHEARDALQRDRVAAIAKVPTARPAIETYVNSVRIAHAALETALANATREYEDAVAKAGDDRVSAEQAADEARRNFNPEDARQAARQDATDAYEAAVHEIRGKVSSPTERDALLKKAAEDKDLVLVKADRAYDAALSNANRVRDKAFAEALSKQIETVASADRERSRKETAARAAFDAALAESSRALAAALANAPEAAEAAAAIDKRISELEQSCQHQQEGLSKRLRGEL